MKNPSRTSLIRRHAIKSMLGLLLVLAFACLGFADEKEWIEVRSQNFRILTDGSDKDARRVARGLEQIRAVFAMTFPALRLDSGAPLLVLAARDEDTAKALLPAMWKQKGAKPAGVFFHHWEKQFAVVRLDVVRPEDYEVVYHEYAHTLLHMNSRWLPIWLDEGLAEFYGGTRYEQDKLIIGAPITRSFVLQRLPFIPTETLIAVNHSSPYYHDEDKAQMFYAESWALSHFLMFSPVMGQGKRLREFLTMLDQGIEQKKAFHDAFGEFKQVDKDLEEYTRRFTIQGLVAKNPPNIHENEFASRRLTQAETDAELGGFHLWNRDIETARPLITRALNEEPKLGLAHENMGFLLFAQGNDQGAAQEFDQAFQFDGKLYLSAYYRAMLSPSANSNADTDRVVFHDAMMKLLELDAQFAPAYIQLARLNLRQGDPERALGLSRKAEQLEPSRAGYHILSGDILLLLGRNAEAAKFAKYVADRWEPPDHDEATELWNRVPAGDRPPSDSPAELSAVAATQGTVLVSGVVESARCGDKESGMTIVVNHDGQILTFHSKGPFRGGFSDTLWYGEDHFSSCRHVNGLRAVIRYRPAADPSYAGDLTELDFRVDFPTVPAIKTEANTAQKKPE